MYPASVSCGLRGCILGFDICDLHFPALGFAESDDCIWADVGEEAVGPMMLVAFKDVAVFNYDPHGCSPHKMSRASSASPFRTASRLLSLAPRPNLFSITIIGYVSLAIAALSTSTAAVVRFARSSLPPVPGTDMPTF